VNNGPAAAALPGCCLGPLRFATGMGGLNAWTCLCVCLAIMPVISFLGFSKPYVLTGIIGIPPEQHGQVKGLLITMHEIVVLAPVSVAGRYAGRFMYAIGLAFVGVMSAVTAADYPATTSRGKRAGVTGTRVAAPLAVRSPDVAG
jgi:hypothetical protein